MSEGRTVVTVVLVPTLEEQRNAGGYYGDILLDPAKVTHHDELPVFVENTYDRLVGRATNIRVEDGRLVAEVEFTPPSGALVEAVRRDDFPHHFSISGMTEQITDRVAGVDAMNVSISPNRTGR